MKAIFFIAAEIMTAAFVSASVPAEATPAGGKCYLCHGSVADGDLTHQDLVRLCGAGCERSSDAAFQCQDCLAEQFATQHYELNNYKLRGLRIRGRAHLRRGGQPSPLQRKLLTWRNWLREKGAETTELPPGTEKFRIADFEGDPVASLMPHTPICSNNYTSVSCGFCGKRSLLKNRWALQPGYPHTCSEEKTAALVRKKLLEKALEEFPLHFFDLMGEKICIATLEEFAKKYSPRAGEVYVGEGGENEEHTTTEDTKKLLSAVRANIHNGRGIGVVSACVGEVGEEEPSTSGAALLVRRLLDQIGTVDGQLPPDEERQELRAWLRVYDKLLQLEPHVVGEKDIASKLATVRTAVAGDLADLYRVLSEEQLQQQHEEVRLLKVEVEKVLLRVLERQAAGGTENAKRRREMVNGGTAEDIAAMYLVTGTLLMPGMLRSDPPGLVAALIQYLKVQTDLLGSSEMQFVDDGQRAWCHEVQETVAVALLKEATEEEMEQLAASFANLFISRDETQAMHTRRTRPGDEDAASIKTERNINNKVALDEVLLFCLEADAASFPHKELRGEIAVYFASTHVLEPPATLLKDTWIKHTQMARALISLLQKNNASKRGRGDEEEGGDQHDEETSEVGRLLGAGRERAVLRFLNLKWRPKVLEPILKLREEANRGADFWRPSKADEQEAQEQRVDIAALVPAL